MYTCKTGNVWVVETPLKIQSFQDCRNKVEKQMNAKNIQEIGPKGPVKIQTLW